MIRTTALGVMFAAALASGGVAAQQPSSTVAKLTGMVGTVLVSEADAIVTAANDSRLKVGARVVTSAGARVTISYDKGCDVNLTENQRFTVRELGECPALIASVETIAVATAATAGIGATAIVVGGLVVGVTAYAIYDANRDKAPNSPN